MQPAIRQLALALACLLATGAATAGSVSVTFTDPGHFADVPFTPWEREEVLKELAAHFDKLGKALPADQVLRIEVLDVDLAGRREPLLRAGRDIRVLNGGADWPHLRLRYALESGGKILSSGEVHLADMAYMDRPSRYFNGESLRFEKQMIDDWFKKTIAPAPAR
jgi:uncharacterized lipoprotein YbaY